MTFTRLAAIPALALTVLLIPASSVVLAASSIVECGQVATYAAPDPGAPAEGSLSIGTLPPWAIAADATISANAAANLPSIVGSSPSCLALDLDDLGAVTALAFAPEGAISGPVVPDAGVGGYIVADRLLLPTFVTDTYPGLAAIFVTSADAGTEASIAFLVDTITGQFTGFDAEAAFCGSGDLDGDGDGLVGDATIPAVVLDAADTAALEGADLRHTCAVVNSLGTIGQEGIVVTTDVAIAVAGPAATPPDTAASPSQGAPSGPVSPIGLLLLVAAALLALGVWPKLPFVRPGAGSASD